MPKGVDSSASPPAPALAPAPAYVRAAIELEFPAYLMKIRAGDVAVSIVRNTAL
jgi:hypothetical protein